MKTSRTKWVSTTLVVAGVAMLALAMGGATYAAWYSNHELDTSAGAGVTHVTISQPIVLTASNEYVVAEASIDVPTQVAHFYAHNLGPGDYAILGMKVTNTGSLPVIMGVDEIAPVTAAVTTGFYAVNSLSNPTDMTIGPAMNGVTYEFPVMPNYSVTLNSGDFVIVYFALGLYSDTPQTMMGTSTSVAYMITGMTVGGNGP